MYRLEHQAIVFGGPMEFNLFGELTQDPTTGLGGSGLEQFMLGAASSNGNTLQQVNWEPYLRFRYWGLYLQDDYRITSNLTLNLGMRYDLFGTWKIRQQPNSNFCLTCVNSLTGLPGKAVYSGDPEFPKGHDLAPANKNDIGPRINFAWTPFKDHKTIIRGGYDIFYSNAFQVNNSIQSGSNSPGYNIDFTWNDSFYPNQCAACFHRAMRGIPDQRSNYYQDELTGTEDSSHSGAVARMDSSALAGLSHELVYSAFARSHDSAVDIRSTARASRQHHAQCGVRGQSWHASGR
jgi:hypothetical protein